MRYPLSPSRENRRSGETSSGKSLPQWPCLLPSVVVGVAPLRNLTGEADRQDLVEGFTDRLVADLFRACRGFSFVWIAGEQRCVGGRPPQNSSDVSYVVSGGIQRGSSEDALRVNIRISDAATADYLWAGRQEFRPEDAAQIRTETTRQISRVLHILLLRAVSRRVLTGLGTELQTGEYLSRATTALKGGVQARPTVEAQSWFLAALAGELRNVEALTGFALTCQLLVSDPWWGDPRATAAASDLGREAVTLALELEAGNPRAKSVQGMLYSAAGQLQEASDAFIQAIAMNHRHACAYAFGGCNAALLGRAWETLPAVERAMDLERTSRRHNSIWYFFGGFAELLLEHTEVAIALLRKSLELNAGFGPAQLFLMAALSSTGRQKEAVSMAGSFRQRYPEYPVNAFEPLWLSRSTSPVYRAQVYPIFERISAL
jgi:TolB-like protein